MGSAPSTYNALAEIAAVGLGFLVTIRASNVELQGAISFLSPAVVIVVVFHRAVASPYCARAVDAACRLFKGPEQFCQEQSADDGGHIP